MTYYRIAQWDRHFENNRTKAFKRLTWLPVPNKQDGDGYTQLVTHKDGAAHLGVWLAVLQVASKCEPRGSLLRDSGNCLPIPHDVPSLSRLTRLDAKTIRPALERLVEIGWLEIVNDTSDLQDAAGIGQDAAGILQLEYAEQNRKEQNRTDNKDLCAGPASADAARLGRVEIGWRVERTWDDHLAQYRGFHEDVDGRVPGGPPPTLTDDIRAEIIRCLKVFDGHLLTADTREQWERESKVRAAGIGLYFDTWCTARHKDNQRADGGKRYLEHWRPWKKLKGKGEPVERFAELYFQARRPTP